MALAGMFVVVVPLTQQRQVRDPVTAAARSPLDVVDVQPAPAVAAHGTAEVVRLGYCLGRRLRDAIGHDHTEPSVYSPC